MKDVDFWFVMAVTIIGLFLALEFVLSTFGDV